MSTPPYWIFLDISFVLTTLGVHWRPAQGLRPRRECLLKTNTSFGNICECVVCTCDDRDVASKLRSCASMTDRILKPAEERALRACSSGRARLHSLAVCAVSSCFRFTGELTLQLVAAHARTADP